MGQVVALERLLSEQRVWRGQASALPRARQPTGHAELDAALPEGGWPEAALTEVLLPADGVGELRLLLPTIARLAAAGSPVVLVAPPYLPFPVAWRQAGVDLAHLHLVQAPPREALWAAEQCLRSGCTGAVLAWPTQSRSVQADDRALRRLQLAADSGRTLGFVFRDLRALANPSPAALRLAIQGEPPSLRVVKCRGGMPPSRDFRLPASG